MSENTAPATTVPVSTAPAPTPPSPASAPAKAAPKSYDAVIKDAKAKAIATAKGEAPTSTPAETPVETKGDAKPTEPKADDQLKQLTRLARQKKDAEDALKAAQHKLQEAETAQKEAAQLREFNELYKGGKRMDAIAKLLGSDATKEMTELLAEYLGEAPKEAKAEDDPLKKEFDELKKRLDDEKTVVAKARQEQERTAALGYINRKMSETKLEDGSDKFELCARPENRAEAYDLALAAAAVLAEARGIDPKATLSPEDSTALLLEAYAEVELELETRGKRYQRTKTAPTETTAQAASKGPASTPSRQTKSPTVRASITAPQPDPNALPGHMSHKAAVELIKAQMRNG